MILTKNWLFTNNVSRYLYRKTIVSLFCFLIVLLIAWDEVLCSTVWRFYSVYSRFISKPTYKAFEVTALSDVFIFFVNHVVVLVMMLSLLRQSSQFRSLRLCVRYLYPLVWCHVTTMFGFVWSAQALRGQQRLYLGCRTRLRLRLWLALSTYSMVLMFSKGLRRSLILQRCRWSTLQLSSNVACQRRHSYQHETMASFALGGYSRTSIVSGSFECVCLTLA